MHIVWREFVTAFIGNLNTTITLKCASRLVMYLHFFFLRDTRDANKGK